MWILILIFFGIGGGIIGMSSSDDGDGALGGCLTKLFAGHSFLTQILICGLVILLTLWLFISC